MKTAVVEFDNGDTVTTDANGTDEEIRQYYAIGRVFNLGTVKDLMAKVISVKIYS